MNKKELKDHLQNNIESIESIDQSTILSIMYPELNNAEIEQLARGVKLTKEQILNFLDQDNQNKDND